MTNSKLVIFDWDGTVMDSVPKIVNCIQQAAITENLPAPSVGEAKNVIGLSLPKAIARLFPADPDKHFSLIAAYKQQYREFDKTATPLFAGVEVALQLLIEQGFSLAVATGKGRDGLERLLDESGLRGYFSCTRCSDDAESKPSPQMLEQILAHFNLTPSQAVMVGDSQLDMAMAKAIAMPRVGVSFGAHTSEQLLQLLPLAVVDNYPQLVATINNYFANSAHQGQI